MEKPFCHVQSSAVKAEQRIGAGQKRSHLQPAHRRESLVELALAGGSYDTQIETQRPGCILCFVDLHFCERPFRIHEQRNIRDLRQDFPQQAHLL